MVQKLENEPVLRVRIFRAIIGKPRARHPGICPDVKEHRMSSDLTRRGFLKAAAAGVATVHSSTSADELPMPEDTKSQNRSFYASRARALVEALQTHWYHAQP